MPWAACRYRPQSLLWNTRVFIFQTTCSDIILIPSTSSNIQQQYPKSLSLFVVVSTPHQLIWWEDAESSTCNSSPWAISQSPNPTGWEQTHKVYSSHFTDKEKGGWWFAQGHKELQRAQSRGQLSQHQDSLGTWAVHFGLVVPANLQEEFPSFRQQLIASLPGIGIIRTINYLDAMDLG